MSRKKPAIYIGSDFSIWMGNTSDSDVQYDPGELFGFGTGVFEEKAVSDLVPIGRFLIFLVSAGGSQYRLFIRGWVVNLVEVMLELRRTCFHGDFKVICLSSPMKRPRVLSVKS